MLIFTRIFSGSSNSCCHGIGLLLTVSRHDGHYRWKLCQMLWFHLVLLLTSRGEWCSGTCAPLQASQSMAYTELFPTVFRRYRCHVLFGQTIKLWFLSKILKDSHFNKCLCSITSTFQLLILISPLPPYMFQVFSKILPMHCPSFIDRNS